MPEAGFIWFWLYETACNRICANNYISVTCTLGGFYTPLTVLLPNHHAQQLLQGCHLDYFVRGSLNSTMLKNFVLRAPDQRPPERPQRTVKLRCNLQPLHAQQRFHLGLPLAPRGRRLASPTFPITSPSTKSTKLACSLRDALLKRSLPHMADE